MVWVMMIFFFFVLGGGQMTVRLVEGRRKHLLELKQAEARLAEAKVKELEIAQQHAELEYRQALLELERFDRRGKGAPPPPAPRDPDHPTLRRVEPPEPPE